VWSIVESAWALLDSTRCSWCAIVVWLVRDCPIVSGHSEVSSSHARGAAPCCTVYKRSLTPARTGMRPLHRRPAHVKLVPRRLPLYSLSVLRPSLLVGAGGDRRRCHDVDDGAAWQHHGNAMPPRSVQHSTFTASNQGHRPDAPRRIPSGVGRQDHLSRPPQLETYRAERRTRRSRAGGWLPPGLEIPNRPVARRSAIVRHGVERGIGPRSTRLHAAMRVVVTQRRRRRARSHLP